MTPNYSVNRPQIPLRGLHRLPQALACSGGDSMDEKARRQYSYLVAALPFTIAGLQVLLDSAPLGMLAFGVAMSVVAFVMFRFLSGVRVFAPGRSRLGDVRAFRPWQAPALWVPVVVTVGAVVFVWLVG
jgi:hypothetical protein